MSANEAIDNFYKIKGNYDTKYNNAKKRIMASDASIARKRARVQSIPLKCVSCKRNVGTRFSVTDRHLKAVCRDSSNPCKLNIDIKLGQSTSINSLDDAVTVDLNSVKVQIIKTKLLLLFGLLDEDRMEEAFLDLKNSYKSLIEVQNVIDGEIRNNQMIKIQEGTGDVRAMRDIERTTLAAANQVKLGNLISDFQRQMREYQNDKSADTKLVKMTDAIDLYLTQIIPTVDTIRTTQYKINTIIKEKNHYKLVQIKMPLKDRVLEIVSPEIISNIK